MKLPLRTSVLAIVGAAIWLKGSSLLCQAAISAPPCLDKNLAACAGRGNPRGNLAQNVWGVANWNSKSPAGGQPSLLQGAQDILALGVQNLKVGMGPYFHTADYTDTDFGDNIHSLTDLAASPP